MLNIRLKEDWFSINISTWHHFLSAFKGRENLEYLEIGAYEGRSLIWTWENILTHPSCRATAIDIFWSEEYEKNLHENIKKLGVQDKTTVYKARSQEVLRTLPRDKFDIIYVDGSHLAPDVIHDAVCGWDLLKPGGIMIFDDYEWQAEGRALQNSPKFAIDSFIYIFHDHLTVLHKHYQVIVQKKSTL